MRNSHFWDFLFFSSLVLLCSKVPVRVIMLNQNHTVSTVPVTAALEVSVKPDGSGISVEQVFTLSHVDFLKSQGVKCLYHFTDERNLPSIAERGLLPWTSLDGVEGAIISSSRESRNIHLQKGLADCVSLCFRPDHPMLYTAKQAGRIEKHVWLKVSLDALLAQQTVKYSHINAAHHEADIRDNDPSHIWFDIVLDPMIEFTRASKSEKGYLQAEVLIPHHVHPRFIEFPK